MTSLVTAMSSSQAVAAQLEHKSLQLRPRTAKDALRAELEEERLLDERKRIKARTRAQERRDRQMALLDSCSATALKCGLSPSPGEHLGAPHVSLFGMATSFEHSLLFSSNQSPDGNGRAAQACPPAVDAAVMLKAEQERQRLLDSTLRTSAREAEDESRAFWSWYRQRHREIDRKYMAQGIFVPSPTPTVADGASPSWSRAVDGRFASPVSHVGSSPGVSEPESSPIAARRSFLHNCPSSSPDDVCSAGNNHSSVLRPSTMLRRAFDDRLSSVLSRPIPFVPGIDDDSDCDDQQLATGCPRSDREKLKREQSSPSATATTVLSNANYVLPMPRCEPQSDDVKAEQLSRHREIASRAAIAAEESIQLLRRVQKTSRLHHLHESMAATSVLD